jgi:DNA (cytosine-5)-methyltransferase 1
VTTEATVVTEASRDAGTSIELFTGGGGLALAMESVGFRHLLAVEIDRRACATLRVNGAEDYAESEPLPSSGGDG